MAAGAGQIRIEPGEVAQAAGQLREHGETLRTTGRTLQLTGLPPRSALPGGAGVVALTAAALRVGSLAADEGSATGATAEGLREFVDTVTDAEAASAEGLSGCRP